MRTRKIFAFVIAVCFIPVLLVLTLLDVRQVYEPFWLLSIAGILFGGSIPLLVSWAAAMTYLKQGSRTLLLMGGGMWTFGLGIVLGSWEAVVADDPNAGATVHNIACLLGALFHVGGGFYSLSSSPTLPVAREGERSILYTLYGGVAAFLTLCTIGATQGWVWPFSVPGVGWTIVRQVVLGSAILSYVAASALFVARYLTKPSRFVYWYALALALIAIGLCAFFLEHAVGDPLSWLGRSAQVTGGLFALVAVITAWRQASAKGIPLDAVMEGFFSDPEVSYRALVESASDAIVALDQNRRIIAWNQAAEKIFGRREAEVIGRDFYDTLIHEDFHHVLAQRVSSGVTEEMDLEAIREGGEIFPAAISCSVRSLLPGWVAVCIIRDVTDQKLAIAQIRALNEDLSGKVEQLTTALDTVRMQNELLRAVQRAQTHFIFAEGPKQILDYLLNDLVTLTQSEFGFIQEIHDIADGTIHVKDWAVSDSWRNEDSRAMYERLAGKGLEFANAEGVWRAIFLNGKPVISNDLDRDPRRTELPEGHPAVNSFLGLPFYSEGTIVGMAGIANRAKGYDEGMIQFLEPYVATCASIIKAYRAERQRLDAERQLADAHADLERKVVERTAELRAANEQLAELVKELEAKNEELEKFSYTVSHDLKTPLITIQSFVSAIMKDVANGNVDQSLKDLERVHGAARTMNSLLQGLLELSRVGRIVNPLKPTPLKEVVEEALGSLQGLITQSGAQVRVARDFPTVIIDKIRMVQVLQNLVENALKFSRAEEPPSIEIGSFAQDNEHTCYVKDRGKGIDPAYREQVFELFRQLDPTAAGIGLGLALVEKIIEHHNGRVWISANDGEPGITFFFSLPRTDSIS